MDLGDQNVTSLRDMLEARKNVWSAGAADEIKDLYKRGIESVVASEITKRAKQVGDLAPDFMLKNALNAEIRLSDYLIKGPVVLTWYRGGWCPYCNITLGRLQKELPKIKKTGSNLFALTPELPDHSLSTKRKNQLEYEVLSDIGNQVAKAYGIAFKLIDDLINSDIHKLDLPSYNGNHMNELPLTATYVIDRDGTIRYAYLDAEYRNRAEPKDIISVLIEIKNESK